MGRNMVVLVWALILGQVVGFIGTALMSSTYDPMQAAIISVICALALNFIPALLDTNKEEAK